MNHLNPQTLRDQDRYVELRTDFAKTRFWSLKDRLGHKYWVQLRRTIEDNISFQNPCRNAFAIVCDVRKSEQERWARKRPDIIEGLKQFAIEQRQLEQTAKRASETTIIEDDDGVIHATFGRRSLS